MAKSYFQFKQFTIHQDHTAMKVSTDACVFGAIIALRFNELLTNTCRILDIGAGTGLLSLMLKQKMSEAVFDAVEIEEGAAKDAQENFKNSEWSNDLYLHHLSAQEFKSDHQYEGVICNPPFFEKQLKSPQQQRLLARHTDQLSWSELIEVTKVHIKENGFWALLLPVREWNLFAEVLGEDWNVVECHYVQPFPTKKPNRVVLILQRKVKEEAENTLIKYWPIYEERNMYSVDITNLLRDYYLYL